MRPQLTKIEEEILKAEENVKRIEAIFSSEDFYEKYAAKTIELNKELEDAKQSVKKLYDRWEELEQIDE